MEKRLVLSFVLSFMVLFLWAQVAPKPDRQPTQSDNSEVIVNNDVTEISSAEDGIKPDEIVASPPTDQPISDQKLYTLENDRFILQFSNLGANLKNAFLKEYEIDMPVQDIGSIEGYEDLPFEIKSQQEKKLEFEYLNQGVKISKIVSIDEGYTLNVDIIVQNESEMSKKIDLDIQGFTLNMSDFEENKNKKEKSDKDKDFSAQRDKGLNEYAISTAEGIKRKNKAYKFNEKHEESYDGQVKWLGFRDRYYCAMVKPDFETKGYYTEKKAENILDIVVKSGESALSPMETKNFSFVTYIGPEKSQLLKEYDNGFENIKRYYKFGLFDGIAKLINWIMELLFKFIHNWGICIILISIIIYYSMYPLTARGMSSMRKMQALQPKIQELKEKHEKNPQKLNQEMLELYKREKINPLGGCLPILFQMPVFIGLYQVLWRNVDFKGASFLWIKDLSRADRLYVMDFSLPVIGNEINLLPLLMMVIMFLQQKFSQKNMTLTDPMQIQQQKMMATVMPLLLGFIFYKFASGLTLYFTMFYIFSTITQWKISKEPKAA